MIDNFIDLMESGLVVRVILYPTEVRLLLTNQTEPVTLPYEDTRLLIEIYCFLKQNGFKYAPLIIMDGLDEWRLVYTYEEIICLIKYAKILWDVTIPLSDIFPITYDDLLA